MTFEEVWPDVEEEEVNVNETEAEEPVGVEVEDKLGTVEIAVAEYRVMGVDVKLNVLLRPGVAFDEIYKAPKRAMATTAITKEIEATEFNVPP